MATEGPKLSTGVVMPYMGLGTWQTSTKEAIRAALDAGYRHIDTAFVYGNEVHIGEVLKEYFQSGKLKRDEVFVTTKLWSSFHSSVMVAAKRSLENLQLDYMDMYLIHTPTGFKKAKDHDNMEMGPDGKPISDGIDLLDTWKCMEEVYNSGLAKGIGLSNCNAEQVERICKNATIKPMNLQVECHLYFPQFEVQEVCDKYGVSLTAYAPLGSPGRVNFKVPGGRNPIDWKESAPKPLEDETVLKLSGKYTKTPAQILLRWLIQRGIIVIPKSVTQSRIEENIQVFDFELTKEEIVTLNSKKIRQRLFYQNFTTGHPEDPFATER